MNWPVDSPEFAIDQVWAARDELALQGVTLHAAYADQTRALIVVDVLTLEGAAAIADRFVDRFPTMELLSVERPLQPRVAPFVGGV